MAIAPAEVEYATEILLAEQMVDLAIIALVPTDGASAIADFGLDYDFRAVVEGHDIETWSG